MMYQRQTMTSVLSHKSPSFIPSSHLLNKDLEEFVMEDNHVEICLTVANLYSMSMEVQYTFHIDPAITIGQFKNYLSPIFFYFPEHIDILLSKSMPYPLADKMQISMLQKADMCELVMQPCGPPIVPCISYLKIDDNKTTIDLQNLPYTDIVNIPYWFTSTPIHNILLNADHPRIDEILYQLAQVISPNQSTIQTITLLRSFPEHHLPLVSNEALARFYHTITDGMKKTNIKVLLDKNIVHNDVMIELGAWLQIKY